MIKIEVLEEVNKNLTSLLTKLETCMFKENIIIVDKPHIKEDKDVLLDTK